MTVSEIQPLLEQFVGPAGTVTDEQFLASLNQVRERYINSGKWKDMVVEEDVTPVDGIVELPAHCESILGAQLDGHPVVVFGSQHEFIPGGPGEVTPGLGGAAALIDQGDRTYKIMGCSSVTSVKLTCKIRYTELTGPSVTSPTGNLVVAGAGVTAANGVYEPVGSSAPYDLYAHRTAAGYRIERQLTEWFLRAPDGTDLYTVPYVDGFPDDLGNSWTRCTVDTGNVIGTNLYDQFDESSTWVVMPPSLNGASVYMSVGSGQFGWIYYDGSGWVAKSDTLGVIGTCVGEFPTLEETSGNWTFGGYTDGGLFVAETSTAASPAPTVTAQTSSSTADETVIPANFGALKLGLQALGYENENDLERSKVYWAEGYTLLNDQTRQARGAAQTVLQQSPHAFNPGRLRALY